MKRWIISREVKVWEWSLSRNPHGGDSFESVSSEISSNHPLAEAMKSQLTPDDETKSQDSRLPADLVLLKSPGEAKPTQFSFSSLNTVSIIIPEYVDFVVCDSPVVLDGAQITLVLELGWCSDSNHGLRIVTTPLARTKFGSAPEAFSSGVMLGATNSHPVLYLLGGGSAVWHCGEPTGVFWNDPLFRDPYETMAIFSTILKETAASGVAIRDAIEKWQGNR